MSSLIGNDQDGTPPGGDSSEFAQARQLLDLLFGPDDSVLIRPIESWTEQGKKRSRTVFRLTTGIPSARFTSGRFQSLLRKCEIERAHTFFGVCPRFGNVGFDFSWQIRTVRCLWADVDNCSVEEALKRCKEAGLPPPSAVVSSGNGVHLYWVLEQPYVIDDVPEPPQVFREFVEIQGRKRCIKFFLERGTDRRINLNDPATGRSIPSATPALSPKAIHLQDVIKGVAAKLSGDHTIDLARLLRLPGTLNRKDERNGRTPVPCRLVSCDGQRYALSEFERYADDSPDAARRRQIAQVPLPTVRKLSAGRRDKLNERITACAIADPGSRSERDFALCCFAIEQGIDRAAILGMVANVGKFAERGETYFNQTWEKAEQTTRETLFKRALRKVGQKPESAPGTTDSVDSDSQSDEGKPPGDCSPIIKIDARSTPVAKTMREITDRLLAVGCCFVRADQLVLVHDQTLSPILEVPELAGLLNQYVEFRVISGGTGEFRPLPSSYGSTWLNHPRERSRLPHIRLFSHNPVYADDWRLVSPGYDKPSGIYYAGPDIPIRDGTEYLDALLMDFCFKQPCDRTNYIGMLLTVVLINQFIGSKPAALFNGNQPELGKTILAQIIAVLRDGQPVETATYNPNDEEFEKRLGSLVRRGATTIIVDNAKARGRQQCIESPCLERSITDHIISFRLLGFSQDIRAENSHLFCLTANSSDVSRDLLTRSVVINLYFEGSPERRKFSIADPEGYAQTHRVELLGELLGMVERWKSAGKPLANVHSRFNKRGWGNIVGGILNACGEVDFLNNVEEVAVQLDHTRREFAELVGRLADEPQEHWTASEMAALCARHGLLTKDLGSDSPHSRSTTMGILAVRYLAERFTGPEGQRLAFHKSPHRKGTFYHVRQIDSVDELPNLGTSAERLPNLAETEGSAP